MIYLADETGRITGTITAHMVGYEETLDAAGMVYVRTEERVDPEAYWVETRSNGERRLAQRLPALVGGDPAPIALGGSWSLPMAPGGAVVAIDGAATTLGRAQPLTIEPEAPGVYDITIEHAQYLPSRFSLTVTA